MPDNEQTENLYISQQLSLSFNASQDTPPPGDACADRYLFVDLETGGLYADKHAVLQVAAVITVCSCTKLLHIVFKRYHFTMTHSQNLATNVQFQPPFHI